MRSRSRAVASVDELARDHFKALLRRITVAMPVTPLLINNSRLVTYYNARASNWTSELLAVVRARAHAPPADPKSAWCRQSLCVTL